MQQIIKRGNVTIGKIHCEIPMLGMEVIVETAFPSADPDGDNQCSSYDQGEERLHLIYEAHCEAVGATPEPRAPKAAEVDPEAEYLALEASRDAEMAAYYDAQYEAGVEADAEVKAADTSVTPQNAAEAEDDLPF